MQKMVSQVVCLLLLVASLGGCSNEQKISYYLRYPQAFRAAFDNCQKQHEQSIVCQQLAGYHLEVTRNLLVAQSNPQQFGATILELQRNLLLEQQQLKQLQHNADNSNQSTIEKLTQDIEVKQRRNHIYLTIVRWLEDPEA